MGASCTHAAQSNKNLKDPRTYNMPVVAHLPRAWRQLASVCCAEVLQQGETLHSRTTHNDLYAAAIVACNAQSWCAVIMVGCAECRILVMQGHCCICSAAMICWQAAHVMQPHCVRSAVPCMPMLHVRPILRGILVVCKL